MAVFEEFDPDLAAGGDLVGQVVELENDGQRLLPREDPVRLAVDLEGADAEGLHPALGRVQSDDLVAEERLGQLDGRSVLGDAQGLLDGHELLRGLVLDQDGQAVVTAEEREEVLEIEGRPARLSHLLGGHVQGNGFVELLDEAAVGRRDPAVDFEGRIVLALVLVDRQPPGLDGVMDEGEARRVAEDLDEAVAVEIISCIFDLDEVLVLEEFLGVLGFDAAGRGRLDPLDENVGGHRRPAVDVSAFAGDERERDGGQGGLGLPQLFIGLRVIGTAEIARQQGLGPVADRAVELVLTVSPFFKKDEVEPRREPDVRLVLIEPDLGIIGRGFPFEPLDVPRFSQDDVDAAPVRLPSRARRVPAKVAVGVVDAAVVLGLEFVFRGPGGRVALFPEGLDEEVALPVGLELEEDLAFYGRDDVADLFLEPFPEIFRKLRLLSLLGGGGGRRDEESAEEQDGKDRCGAFRCHGHSRIPSLTPNASSTGQTPCPLWR